MLFTALSNDFQSLLQPIDFQSIVVGLSDLEKLKTALVADIAKLLKSDSLQPENKWLKSKEVRKLLNISPGTLQSLRIKGVLPFTKIGGIMYYSSEDVNNIMTSKKGN